MPGVCNVRRIVASSVAAYFAVACGQEAADPSPAASGGPVDAPEDLALLFDGDDYANTGTAGFPFPEAPHSVSFWLNHDGDPGIQVAVALRKDWDSGLAIGVREGLLGAWNVFGPRTFVEDPARLAPREWHHVAYVHEGQHRLYLDGREVASGEREQTRRTPTTGWLGSPDGFDQFFRGRIDEVRIWTAARTPEQIAAEAAGELPAAGDPALVAWFTFDEIGGVRVYDRSGRENHAILGDGIEPHVPARVPSDRAGSR